MTKHALIGTALLLTTAVGAVLAAEGSRGAQEHAGARHAESGRPGSSGLRPGGAREHARAAEARRHGHRHEDEDEDGEEDGRGVPAPPRRTEAPAPDSGLFGGKAPPRAEIR